jgi:hypothetical protein
MNAMTTSMDADDGISLFNCDKRVGSPLAPVKTVVSSNDVSGGFA